MSRIESLSITPRYQADSSWWEHVPIAHFLIEMLKPEVVVELGSHYGVSFFAFCEAAEILSNNTYTYAVDSWEGDEQAGYYKDEVYEAVSNHRNQYHKQRSALLRKLFDEAVNHFDDESIDLLHIDGLHTYEAVKHDFELWLPKLKMEGTILFHDWNERKDGFGVWKLWEEIKKDERFRCIQLPNGHGLGIATLSNEVPIWHNLLIERREDLKCKGMLLSNLNEAYKKINSQKEEIYTIKKHSENLENMYESQSKELEDAGKQIEHLSSRKGIMEILSKIIKSNT